jgi:hypothetical protein
MNKHTSLSLIDLATVIGGTTNNRINAAVTNRQRATIVGNGNLHESQVMQEMNNTFIQEEQQVNQTVDMNQSSFLI